MSKKKKITLATVAGILVLGGLLAACGGGGSSSSGSIGSTPPAAYVPYDSNGEGLPLGTRQYVEEAYPDSARERAALFQYAKVLEAAIRDADSKELSVQHTKDVGRAVICTVDTVGSVREASEMMKNMDSVVLNTDERNLAYFKYLDKVMAPGVQRTPTGDRSSMCDVSPTALPN